MREIVVVSGKGGTGKTSVVASFAALAAINHDKAVLADCDVDAADLHLVLAPDVKRREEFRAGHVARIRQADCVGCGACLAYCRFDAVVRSEDDFGGHRFSIDETACEGCGVCVRFCPAEAVDFPDKVAGKFRTYQLASPRLSTAHIGTGTLLFIAWKAALSRTRCSSRAPSG